MTGFLFHDKNAFWPYNLNYSPQHRSGNVFVGQNNFSKHKMDSVGVKVGLEGATVITRKSNSLGCWFKFSGFHVFMISRLLLEM